MIMMILLKIIVISLLDAYTDQLEKVKEKVIKHNILNKLDKFVLQNIKYFLQILNKME